MMRFHFALLLLIAVTIFAFIAKSASNAQAQSPKKPNFVLVLADDLDYELFQSMPKTQQLLVSAGSSFSNFLVTDSLCCTSRTSILRGQYLHNHQVLGNNMPEGGFKKFYTRGTHLSAINTWLQQGGYRTAMLGKYLNGYPGRNYKKLFLPGWDLWFAGIGRHSYVGLQYSVVRNDKIEEYGQSSEDFLTDVLGRRAQEFIRQAKASAAPFFAYVAPFSPHKPISAATRHKGLFKSAQLPVDPAFNEADVSDKPLYIQRLAAISPRTQVSYDKLHRKRLRAVQSIDDLIEGLVKTVADLGLLQNTYIIFSSDNGIHMGQHRLPYGKRTPYETDIKVPFVIRGPSIPAGQIIDKLASEIDIAPTLAELAGAPAPSFVDGRSLLPVLSSGNVSSSWRESVLLEHFSHNIEPFDDLPAQEKLRSNIPPFKGLRTKRYTYVEYSTGEKELYDLIADPYQLQNLISNANPLLLSQYSNVLQQLQKCAGQTCRNIENMPLSEIELN